jgi:hypothetical protein
MSLLRLAGRVAALLVALPCYFLAYLSLLSPFPGPGGVRGIDFLVAGVEQLALAFVVGTAALFVALGATYVGVVAGGPGARALGVSLGTLLLVVAIVFLATLFNPAVGLSVGVVGLVLLFAGASVGDAGTDRAAA